MRNLNMLLAGGEFALKTVSLIQLTLMEEDTDLSYSNINRLLAISRAGPVSLRLLFEVENASATIFHRAHFSRGDVLFVPGHGRVRLVVKRLKELACIAACLPATSLRTTANMAKYNNIF